MEPLAVLGLVANIVQLVDAGAKAFTICREIYTLGATVEDARMASTSKHLLDAYDEMVRSPPRHITLFRLLGAFLKLKDTLTLRGSAQNKTLVQSSNSSSPAGNSSYLVTLATQCSGTARELNGELVSLRKAPGGGLRDTIRTTWLKKKKSKSIDRLKLALDEYQKTLDSKVLIDVRQALGELSVEQEAQGKNLKQQLSQMSSGIKACHLAFANQLRSEIDKYILTSEAQHETTREHVTAAIQDLTLSQNEHFNKEKQHQHSQQQHDQFLDSLRFNEMHTRMNEVEEPHADTFQWIFEEDASRPWDSFCNWLRDDDTVYWISGKPGSGKSTLMKFLIKDARTIDLLTQWTPGQQPLVVGVYFWLSGTEMQRSLKGFLCSVIYQIVRGNRLLFEKVLRGDPGLLSKRNPGDWSKRELREFLMHLIGLLDRPLCFFLDGLDELDQGDVDQLFNLVDGILETGKAKICASSRPEHYIAKRMAGYKQLRLQDLTAKDMEICIRTTLEETRARCRPASINEAYLREIIKTIARKADGVFLWVHYALSSLVRGMRNEDTFEDLTRRIEHLPSGMHQLYLQMWNRLNEDKQQYQEQAAAYFSYAAEFIEKYPISLFELMIALNPQLQSAIVDDLKPQNPTKLAQDCIALRTRVITRSAGLLEFSMEPDTKDKHNQPTASSRSNGTLKYTDNRAHGLPNQNHQSLCGSAGDRDVKNITLSNLQNDDLPRVVTSHNPKPLSLHHSSKLKYLHRTARDFLMGTEDGQKLSGRPKELPVTSSFNVIRARMAALVLGLIDFEENSVHSIMSSIQFHCRRYSNQEHETGLVVALRRLCQKLSIPGDRKNHIGYREFWDGKDKGIWRGRHEGFECLAAYHGFAKYIQNFVLDRDSYIDPHCRGLLAKEAAYCDVIFNYDSSARLALFSWLASNGADLHMNYMLDPPDSPESPAVEVLCEINSIVSRNNKPIPSRLYDTICYILPYLLCHSCNGIVRLAPRELGKIIVPSATSWLLTLLFGSTLHVQISVLKLCYYVMDRVEQAMPHKPQLR